MFTTFLFCALIGGTVFVIQFVMAVIGFGADELDFGGDVADAVDIPDDVGDVQGSVIDHGSTWLFGVLSFRTIVAALTFFGLGGMAAIQAGQSGPISLLIAIGAGGAAMYGVHFLMQALYKLRHDGSLRIERSVGQTGTVYIPIPGNNAGAGKIQLRVQGRVVEYAAMTPDPEKLGTGTRVVVTSVVSPTTLEVEPIHETVNAAEEKSV